MRRLQLQQSVSELERALLELGESGFAHPAVDREPSLLLKSTDGPFGPFTEIASLFLERDEVAEAFEPKLQVADRLGPFSSFQYLHQGRVQTEDAGALGGTQA